MRCGRTWAFEEKPERQIYHRSTKSAFCGSAFAHRHNLPAIAERHHAHPALRLVKFGCNRSVNSNFYFPRRAAEFMFAILNLPIEETNRFSFPLLHNCTL
jgi:hypothetical protein